MEFKTKTQRLRLKYTPVEAAQFLGISLEKLRKLTNEGRIRMCQYGREQYFLGGELDCAKNSLYGNNNMVAEPKQPKSRSPRPQDRAAAHTWYAQHKFHVDQMLANYTGPAYAPSGSDCIRPELWKDSHWKWLLEKD